MGEKEKGKERKTIVLLKCPLKNRNRSLYKKEEGRMGTSIMVLTVKNKVKNT